MWVVDKKNKLKWNEPFDRNKLMALQDKGFTIEDDDGNEVDAYSCNEYTEYTEEEIILETQQHADEVGEAIIGVFEAMDSPVSTMSTLSVRAATKNATPFNNALDHLKDVVRGQNGNL